MEQPPEHREIIQAVKALNAAEMFGQQNELLFHMDRQSRRIVRFDRLPCRPQQVGHQRDRARGDPRRQRDRKQMAAVPTAQAARIDVN